MLDYKGKISNSTSRTFEELIDYHTNFSLHKQGEEFEENFQKSKISFLKVVYQFLIISNNSDSKTHYTYYGRIKLKVLFKSIIYKLKTKFCKMYIDRNLSREIEKNVKFVYYSMHIEQERSLLLLAPFYTN